MRSPSIFTSVAVVPSSLSRASFTSSRPGPSGFKPFHAAYRDAFPDVQIQIDRMIAEDDLVAVHWHATATHNGGGLGFAATRRPVQFSGMAIARFEGNKLVEGWNNFDQLGLLQQIGVVSLPAS